MARVTASSSQLDHGSKDRPWPAVYLEGLRSWLNIIGIYRGYIVIMEKKMEATIVFGI